MHRKLFLLAALVALATSVVVPRSASAGINIAASIGEGFAIHKGDFSRTPVNFEALPNYSIGPVHIDLGFVFHFEDQIDLLIRPGVRVSFWLLYLRAAVPMKVTDGFDYGFMAGIGGNLFNVGVLSLFLEADASIWKETDFRRVPIEFRLGVEIGF